jgi:hypothetical protein
MSTLDELGTRHKAALAEIAAIKDDLHAAMRAERFNQDGSHKTTQSDIMIRSGYKTIQQVRVITGEAKEPAKKAAG